MGCCGNDEVEHSSHNINRTPPSNNDQVLSTDRSCTDILALIVLILILGGFGFCMSLVIPKGDIYRVINGYDDCANTCGRITSKELVPNPEFSCKGRDMRNESLLYEDLSADGVRSRKCVSNCSSISSDHVSFLNRCVSGKLKKAVGKLVDSLGLEDFFHVSVKDLSEVCRELIYLLLIATGASLLILIAFRYTVQYVIYIVLSGTVVVCSAGTTYLWWAWYKGRTVPLDESLEIDSSFTNYLVYAIISSVVTVIVILVVFIMRKRIALVVQLLREAGKAIYSMPALVLTPIFTYLFLTVTIVGLGYCLLMIESAGELQYDTKTKQLNFKKNILIKLTRWYNVFVFFLLYQFYMGCQHMIIAGAVARWFFTRNKNQLSLPVVKSTATLFRFHLGTVAFGAMIIAVVRLIRAILSFIQKQLDKYDNAFIKGALCCCQCCMWLLDCILESLTRNAYIETAIYGCDFCTGGKKAFRVLSDNVLRVVAINSVGDFVLFVGKVLIVAITIGSGILMLQRKEGLHNPWVPIVIAGIFAYLIADIFISVYEMVIDTIFICFCEDCEKNDGISRPYYMSRNFMFFVEDSKKVIRALDMRR